MVLNKATLVRNTSTTSQPKCHGTASKIAYRLSKRT